MQTCNKCLLTDRYPNITFNEEGTCRFCSNSKQFELLGEEKFLAILQYAKNANAEYDALVPLSGGKDSTYILHLAVNVYKLRVLSMTYDNGLLSDIALRNIQRALEITKVKHIFCKPNTELQKRVYRNMLLLSGDICGACDIATKANILKVSKDYRTPIILYGISPLENDSFVPDSIQDISRFKYIQKQDRDLTRKEINEFLIYPNLNLFRLSLLKKAGRVAKEVSPLFFIKNPTDSEMGDIITREMGWEEDKSREYSKHFDCIAEPLTNHVRYMMYGYDRRICQYSNMIRRDEITREEGARMLAADRVNQKPANAQEVLNHLGLTEKNLDSIVKIPPLKYEKHTSKINRLFTVMMKLKNHIKAYAMRIKETHKLDLVSILFFFLYLLLFTANSSIDAWGYALNIKQGNNLFLPHHLLHNSIGFLWVKAIGFFINVDTLKLLIVLNALFAAAILYLLGLTLRLLGVEGKRIIVWVAFVGSSWAIMRYATENETYIIPMFFSLLGSYFFIKNLKDNRFFNILLSGLFATVACLFHQVMFFWWLSLLIGVAFRKQIRPFIWFGPPAFLVPFSYLLVLVFYYGQPLTLDAFLHLVFNDYYSGAAGISTGLSSFMLLVIGVVRSFFQVHGYITNLSHFSFSFYFGVFFSIILLVWAGTKIRQIHWNWVNVKEQTIWVHILAIILQAFFAVLSSGNAEFLVMIPLLGVIVLSQLISNEIRFIGLFTLGMLLWNFSVGLLPLHFYNLDNSNALSVRVIKGNKEATQPLYVLFNRPRIENEVEYNKGYSPKNLVSGLQYDDINAVKTRINDALANGIPVITDCYNRPCTLSRETLVVSNNYENLFSDYRHQKIDSVETLTGKYYLYSVIRK